MTTQPNFVDTLLAVIELAAEILARPSAASRLGPVTALAMRVDSERAVLVEGGNPIRGETSMLLDALGHIEAERESRNVLRADAWCMVAGVLLPMVRQNTEAALVARARVWPSTTDHDFGRR